MFARSFAAIVFVLPTLAAASALPPNDGLITNNVRQTGPTMVNQCNTGSLQCCNDTQSVQSSTTASLLGLLGFVTGGPDTLIGSNCSPLSIAGVAENSCTAQPVCCNGNNFRGVIVLGCTPIDIGAVGSVAGLVADLSDVLDII